MFEAREFTSTQRQQVNLLQAPRIHLPALRAGIPNASPASKSDLPWPYLQAPQSRHPVNLKLPSLKVLGSVTLSLALSCLPNALSA